MFRLSTVVTKKKKKSWLLNQTHGSTDLRVLTRSEVTEILFVTKKKELIIIKTLVLNGK